jgi:hypothetical protein
MEQNDNLRLYLDAKFSDLSGQIANIGTDQQATDKRVEAVSVRVTALETKNARNDGAAIIKAGIGATILSLISGALGFLGAIFGVLPHHH